MPAATSNRTHTHTSFANAVTCFVVMLDKSKKCGFDSKCEWSVVIGNVLSFSQYWIELLTNVKFLISSSTRFIALCALCTMCVCARALYEWACFSLLLAADDDYFTFDWRFVFGLDVWFFALSVRFARSVHSFGIVVCVFVSLNYSPCKIKCNGHRIIDVSCTVRRFRRSTWATILSEMDEYLTRNQWKCFMQHILHDSAADDDDDIENIAVATTQKSTNNACGVHILRVCHRQNHNPIRFYWLRLPPCEIKRVNEWTK